MGGKLDIDQKLLDIASDASFSAVSPLYVQSIDLDLTLCWSLYEPNWTELINFTASFF